MSSRKNIYSFVVISLAIALVGCISSGLKVTEVESKADSATLVGSINYIKGAQVTSYITEIDGVEVDVQRGYNREYKSISHLPAGEHNVTIEARQGRNAIASFKVNFEAGKVYVAQAMPLSISEMQVWITELNSSVPVTEKLTVLKGKPNANIGIVNELMYHHEACKKHPENEVCK